MKSNTWPLFGALLLVPAIYSHASSVDYVVVAEQPADVASKDPGPSRPITFAAYDGGFIEAGNPVAGDAPPQPSMVAQAVLNGARAQGYEPSNGASLPAVVLIYHWGVIAPGFRRGLLAGSNLESNFKARLYLSTTTRIARDIEEQILSRTSPLGYRSEWQDSLSRARDRRYFAIISAYDFTRFTHGEKKLLWRVKLSAQDRAGEMREVIPALLQSAALYFGRNLARPETGEAVLVNPPARDNGDTAFSIPVDVLRRINPDFLHTVMKQEYFEFSGELFSGK